MVSARYKKSELISACSVFVSLVSEVHELGRFREECSRAMAHTRHH